MSAEVAVSVCGLACCEKDAANEKVPRGVSGSKAPERGFDRTVEVAFGRESSSNLAQHHIGSAVLAELCIGEHQEFCDGRWLRYEGWRVKTQLMPRRIRVGKRIDVARRGGAEALDGSINGE